ncbi:DUF1310 family protein [Enterococcus sp. 5H]|uniref:DUF1310 family protein n=1 Tax=Enterococcus sp. 5H TaxID=1229490 RepID=UPI0023040D14|nr:DUF1310 family protein [Enterococcus sp. 5H]MDA9471181.1 putative secreted protein [Enterococcus sp. 5H]
MKKKKWWILLFLVIVFLVIAMGIGGKIRMDQKELDTRMLEVVKSDEAKKVFEEGLKNLDPNALTPDGIIQTYKTDYKSVKHNPMGGIMFTVYINGDEELYIKDSLNKYGESPIEGGASALSPKLSELLKEREKND